MIKTVLKTVCSGFFLATLLSFVTPADAAYVLKDFSVRNVWKTSYDTLANVSVSGSTVELRFSLSLDASEPTALHRASFSLPSGFSYVSGTVDSSGCSVSSPLSATNQYFSFDYLPSGSACDAFVTARYSTVSASSGALVSVSGVLLDSVDDVFANGNDLATSTNSVKLAVGFKKELLRARTVDSDADGYLDALDLLFSGPVTSSPVASDFAVATDTLSATGISFSGTLGTASTRLRFTDGLFSTADLPVVTVSGTSAEFVSGEYFGGVVEDAAAPHVTVSPSGGTFTGAVSVTLAQNESGNVRYALTGTANAASTLYSSPFSIASATTLSVYASDPWGNASVASRSFAFQCGITAPANGTVSAYPGCTVSCNSGYVLKDGLCSKKAYSSGGGGGGGIVSVPPVVSTGSTTSPTGTGAVTSSGSTGSVVGTGSSATPDNFYPVDSLYMGTLDRWYFADLESAKAFLDTRLTDTVLKRQSAMSYRSLDFADRKFYLLADPDLALGHRRAVNAYVLYYLRLQEKKTSGSSVVLQKEILASGIAMRKGFSLARLVPAQYVKKAVVPVSGGTVYRSLDAKTARALVRTERTLVLKLRRAYATKKLSKTEYLDALSAYNRYVVASTLYAKFGLAVAKARADAAMAEFLSKLPK